MKSTRILTALILFFSFALTANASAFTIYPSYTHEGNSSWVIHNVKPGDTIKDYLTVENLSSKPAQFRVYFVEGVEENGKVLTKPEDDTGEHIGKLVSPAKQTVNLAAGEKEQIEFQYALPREFSEGDYLGVFYAEEISPEHVAGAVNVKTRIGVRMYTNVSKLVKPAHTLVLTFGQKLFFVVSAILLLVTFLWNFLYYNFHNKNRKKLSH